MKRILMAAAAATFLAAGCGEETAGGPGTALPIVDTTVQLTAGGF